MRIPMLRAAAALLILTASAAHAPASAPARSSSLIPLGVDMECFHDWGGNYTCQAYPFGGTETGYTITWTNSHGNVTVVYADGGYVEATAACYPGSYNTAGTVTATVRDSSGATASRSRLINCGY